MKVAPEVALANEIPVLPPVQIVCVTGVAITTGIGLTVITTVIGEPVHPFAEGVMVYVTVAGAKVALTNVCVMLVPDPLENPDAEPDVTAEVQVKLVPATEPVSETPVVIPEHIACEAGVAVTVGVGLITTAVADGTTQPFTSVTETLYVPEAIGSTFARTGFWVAEA